MKQFINYSPIKNYTLYKKTNKLLLTFFFHKINLLDCNSRLLLFKILINLLIELVSRITSFSESVSSTLSPQTLSKTSF